MHFADEISGWADANNCIFDGNVVHRSRFGLAEGMVVGARFGIVNRTYMRSCSRRYMAVGLVHRWELYPR